MKTFGLTILLVSLFLRMLGQAAPVETESYKAPPAYQKLESQFASSALSLQQREDFTLRAGQKIRDLIDLLNLMSNPELDPELKERSRVSALRLFAHPDALVGVPEPKGKVLVLEAEELLTSYSKKKTLPLDFQLSELTAQSDWIPNEKGGFSQNWTFVLERPGAHATGTEIRAELLLEQRMKSFGGEMQPVWEVLINRMEP